MLQVLGGGGAAAADLARLERRQEAILARLGELRSQVEEARQRGGGVCSLSSAPGPPPEHVSRLSLGHRTGTGSALRSSQTVNTVTTVMKIGNRTRCRKKSDHKVDMDILQQRSG